MCIEQRFSSSAITASSLLGLIPTVICSKDVSLETALEKYKSDMKSPELLELELRRWKNRYLSMSPDEWPSSTARAIKECDQEHFPNISVLLKIACTLPVTSCECERSGSVLRRLNNYMSASNGEKPLVQPGTHAYSLRPSYRCRRSSGFICSASSS